MNEFRRLAAKIDQHMQQLAAQGVSEAHAIINRMMGYGPDLHRIWVGTSDQQLMALSRIHGRQLRAGETPPVAVIVQFVTHQPASATAAVPGTGIEPAGQCGHQ